MSQNILTALGKGKKAIAKAHWEGTKAFSNLETKTNSHDISSIHRTITFRDMRLYCFYLLVYAIAATGNRTDKYSESRVKHRFAILIPAYQDDDYIPYTVKSFLQQEYPIDCYDIIVISDHLKPETNRQLAQYPITLLQARFKKSSK